MLRKPPNLSSLFRVITGDNQRIAIVLAGHNGSGKSSLWRNMLADRLQMPLVNADRLILSLLPEPVDENLKPWAVRLRDEDERWQKLAQKGVQGFMELIRSSGMSFAYETVFSHLEKKADGTMRSSKIDGIIELQELGYFVVLLFVGLASEELSILRVQMRKRLGGHDVPEEKLRARFPRTQQAISLASSIADMTVMVDNSRGRRHEFVLARAQKKLKVLYDCRDPKFIQDTDLVAVADLWLSKVAPL